MGPTGATGPMGPAGPAGPMPMYWAGWVTGAGAVQFGNGFKVSHTTGGSYTLTMQGTSTSRLLAATATALGSTTTTRVTSSTKDPKTFVYTIVIEVKNLQGVAQDSDFNFIAVESS
jgi:hypothetical protein